VITMQVAACRVYNTFGLMSAERYYGDSTVDVNAM